MTRTSTRLACLVIGAVLAWPTPSRSAELTRDYAIGLQSFAIGLDGKTPGFGGISFRYNKLAPIYLHTVGRFVLDAEGRDHMVGAGISRAIVDYRNKYNLARLYFTLEGGSRFEKERGVTTTTIGLGLSFGGEVVFSLAGIPVGLNVQIGQGLGREKTGSIAADRAGVYVGMGVHAYF